MSDSRNPPIEVLRDGSLKVSIWKNEGENGSYLSTTFAKTYTKDSEAKDGHVFGKNDLLPMAELARRAYSAINFHRNRMKTEETVPSPETV